MEGLHPLDASLNVPPEFYSHGVRQRVAEQAAQNSFDETVAHMAKTTGAPVPKRQVEQLVGRGAQDFEAFYAERAIVAEDTTDLLVLTFDGKGIAMRREDLREATKKAAERTPRRLETRITSGEKRNRKRMTTVAAVYTIAPHPRTVADVLHDLRPVRDVAVPRPRPRNKRVWASVAAESVAVIREAFREALRRDPQKARRWVVLIDGNETQLDLVKKVAKENDVEITIVLDLIHVLEYLWSASYCFFPAGTVDAEAWVQQRLMWLLQGRSGGDIAGNIRRFAKGWPGRRRTKRR